VTVKEALQLAERELAAAGVDTPRVDAELLVAHALGVSRSQIYLDAERQVPDTFQVLLQRRRGREPLAYVLGEWGFRRLLLKTDPRALVPRPETEIVVERALALIADIPEPRVLDIGTGTGAIVLAIADEHPGAHVVGVDTSAEALELARENATTLGLEVDLRLVGIETASEGWDLVVANPPYIPSQTLATLPPELDWEPRQALVDVGLHEQIARLAKTRYLVFEVGYGQAGEVATTLEQLGYSDVKITRDLADIERVVEGRR
jgi:release factor glutamine methyltransferase